MRLMLRALLICCWLATPGLAQAQAAPAAGQYDKQVALANSQAAIGRQLGDYSLTDSSGKTVRISDYTGKPLLISMIFTSCYHICPATTQHIKQSIEAAREVLDEDSFQVVTIGFDTARDTPDAMRVFAREQGAANIAGWKFLSANQETIEKLAVELGFIYFPSPRGFDHLTQFTVVDRHGVVYTQVYGMAFDLPWLMEPLKEMVYNRPRAERHMLRGLLDRVRLFCTVYDPTTGRYKIDYSLFFQIASGLMIVLGVSFYLFREIRRARQK